MTDAIIYAWREEQGDVWTGEWALDRVDQWVPAEANKYILATPEALAASPEAAKLIADAEARGMERAVHVMPHYFAVYSVTGVHIGVWEDGQIAGDVLAEYAGGSIVEMVPISAIRAEAAAIRRAAEGEKA